MNKLIDAEALKESVRKKFKAIPDRCEINGLVNAAPAIDAIPVEWLWVAQNKMLKSPRYSFEECAVVGQLIRAWQKEQEVGGDG